MLRARAVRLRHQVVRGSAGSRPASIAGLRDERARLDHAPARRLAVEADPHEAAGAQQRKQHAPSSIGVRHVVQHAVRLDQVEVSPECGEPHDVGLRVFDVEPERARSCRIGEARAAQVDREHARPILPRRHDGVLPGAAARDQNVRTSALFRCAQRSGGKHLAQESLHAGERLRHRRAHPTRVRVRLILCLDRL